jgi:hypothetical protein
LNNLQHENDFEKEIFDFNISRFDDLALRIFQFQYRHNPVYNRYANTLGVLPEQVKKINDIPFLPIDFFKSQKIVSTAFVPELVFESSGTTQTVNSKHYLKSKELYRQSFLRAFKLFYGDPGDWCFIGLLPSYLERNNSSLVVMADELIRQSRHEKSGFYLYDFEKLASTLEQLETARQKTLLIGVTFALLDFAEQFPMRLQNTIVMETGGMKGRKHEMTRSAVHEALKQNLGLSQVHSEYGMTELLSQAYSKSDGIFTCAPWMKVLLRSEDDPLAVFDTPSDVTISSGIINIVDFANIYSCSFIATDDVGKLYPGGSFEVLGRVDNSDIRGCSLLVV